MRVGRADGGQLVGVVQPGLHERALAVELEALGSEGRAGQLQLAELQRIEFADEGEVVHGEDAGRPRPGVQRQVRAGQRRVPVVRMDQVGAPVAIDIAAAQMRRHPAEQAEAARVVGPVAAVRRQVRVAGPVVQERRVDQVDRQVEARQPTAPHFDRRRAEGAAQARHHAGSFERVEQRRIAGQQQPHVGAGTRQRRRQRRDHVAEAAGLDPREDLGGDLQQSHAAARRLPSRDRHRQSLASMLRVISVMPPGVRRK